MFWNIISLSSSVLDLLFLVILMIFFLILFFLKVLLSFCFVILAPENFSDIKKALSSRERCAYYIKVAGRTAYLKALSQESVANQCCSYC